ncbi:hypothetical protein ACFVXQ_32045, partial [Kitasatospora sp. NPDC058263]
MVHPAITRLAALLGEPSAPGDTVDWDELAQTTGLRLPADYRDFVALYGGGGGGRAGGRQVGVRLA